MLHKCPHALGDNSNHIDGPSIPSEKEGLFGDKKNQTKLHSAEKKTRKRGPFTFIRFCRLRLKSKKPKVDPLE